jgi:hypothetical protein
MAALIGAGFSILLTRQFLVRRKPHQMAWAIALGMFSLAALVETIGFASGWTDLAYRTYYLLGGLLNVTWLALGTLYLFKPGRTGNLAAAIVIALSLLSVVAIFASTTDPTSLRATIPPPRHALIGPAVILAPILNILGSVVLIGGAALSAWTAWRRHGPINTVIGTATLAAGAFVIAGGHSFAQTYGVYILQPLSEAFGITLMFGGYLIVEIKLHPSLQPSLR